MRDAQMNGGLEKRTEPLELQDVCPVRGFDQNLDLGRASLQHKSNIVGVEEGQQQMQDLSRCALLGERAKVEARTPNRHELVMKQRHRRVKLMRFTGRVRQVVLLAR